MLAPREAPREKVAAALRCLILITVFLMARFDREPRAEAFDWVLAVGAAYVLLTTFLPWSRYDPRRASILMLAVDVALITALIYTQSGVHSEYYLLYYLPIVHASVRLDFRDAVSTCLLSIASYLLIGLLERPGEAVTVTVVSRVSTFAVSAGLLAAFFVLLSREQRAYQQLTSHYQQAMQAKDDFLSRVSHELRTPLTAIVGFSQLLYQHEREVDPSRQHEYLNVIRHQAQHLAYMIEDMLDIARLEDGRLILKQEPVRLQDAIQSSVMLLEELGDSQRLAVSVDSTTPLAWVDRREIEQAISRILFHVSMLSDQQHPIHIRAEPASGGPSQVRITITSAALHGLAASLSALLAAPPPAAEDTLTNSGNLGLKVARGLIELHGGRISLEEDESGPAVTFTLPACQAEGTQASAEPRPSTALGACPELVERVGRG